MTGVGLNGGAALAYPVAAGGAHSDKPFPIAASNQTTLGGVISCVGIGLHSGKKAKLTLLPAEENTGIRFRRVDLSDRGADIAAHWSNVRPSQLCTVIGNKDGVSVRTIEHLMAALSGMSVDNVLIEIDGPEIPAMDGSSAPFVFLLECVGLLEQNAPRTGLRIKKPLHVTWEGMRAGFDPAPHFRVAFEIDFATSAIGKQHFSCLVNPQIFKNSVSRARTFGQLKDIARIRSMSLGLGGSLDNTVVVDDKKVLNKNGLRYHNEFVRHKALDAIGDLALAGKPLIGAYTGSRSGHALNAALVKALLSTPEAWEEVELTGTFDQTAVAELKPLLTAAVAF